MSQPEWMAQGACGNPEVNPDLWFADDQLARNTAKKICNTKCPVREQCLDYALNFPVSLTGVWGGVGARTLRMRRQAMGLRVTDERTLAGLPPERQEGPSPDGPS